MSPKERRAAYMRTWRQNNIERARASGRASYRRNAEARRAAVRAYAKTNQDKIRTYRAAYRADPTNRARAADYHREYGKQYREMLKARRRAARPPRKVASPEEHRIKTALRTRIYKALHGIAKSRNTMGLIGCSYDELRVHIERQFQGDMSWANHGTDGWHLDHIRPCASFDLTDPAEQAKCFHYTNLRPLWAHDNLTKFTRWAA